MIKYSQEKPAFEQILELYESVGWTNYTQNPDMMKQALDASLYTLYAYEGEELLGLVRAVGDGFSSVFIQDLLVKPDHQRKGIGKALMEQVLTSYSHAYQIKLATEASEKNLAFYKSLGFQELKNLACIGMIYRK